MNRLLGKNFKIVLLTGSSSLVGKAIIKSLSKNCFLICIDKKISRSNSSENVLYIQSDVTNEKRLNEIKKKIEKKFKKIDVVINCFISQNYEPFERQSLKKFSMAVTNNICGTFLITKIFFKLLKKSNSAQIINFGSIYGMVSGDPSIYPNKKVTSDAYAASKAAIIQLTKYYAVHLSKHQIRVNCISPGGIFNNQNRKLVKNYIKKVPLKRMAELNEIVNGVNMLMKDGSKYINGHNLVIDGGFTIL